MSEVVGSYEAKNHFSRLLAKVAHGERVTITKHGIPVAQIVPVGSGGALSPEEAVERLFALRRGITLGNGASIKEMIEEGRR